MRCHDKSSLTNILGFVFCPAELFVWQAPGFQHFRFLEFHISDYWISTCPDSWKCRLPQFQFFLNSRFHIVTVFVWDEKSQEFLDNCLVLLRVLVSCSCKTYFFTYCRTREHMYAHPGTFSKEANAFVLGNYFLKAFRATLRWTTFHFHHPHHADHVLLLLTFALQFGSSLCHCALCSASMASARAKEMAAQGSAFDVPDVVADPQRGTRYKARVPSQWNLAPEQPPSCY